MTTNAQGEKWSKWINWNSIDKPPTLHSNTRIQAVNDEGDTLGEGDWHFTARDCEWSEITAYRYKIKEPESGMHPDLKKIAYNFSVWPKWAEKVQYLKVDGEEDRLSFVEAGSPIVSSLPFFFEGDVKAARQQLGLDQPEVTPEEDEAWQAKEREMSIDEARAILSNDNVNHPQHYQSDNGIECIDAIRAALGLDGFVAHCRGTAIKYAFRAGKKQAHAEDLRKAAWYLERAAEALEE